jgi:hypothetical protein
MDVDVIFAEKAKQKPTKSFVVNCKKFPSFTGSSANVDERRAVNP